MNLKEGKLNRIKTIYFSPTGTTKRVIKSISMGLGKVDKEYDITLEKNRKNPIEFNIDDLVIFGVPVYSGRVPDLLLDFFKKIKGNASKAVFVAVYGNRGYDDTLLELQNIFKNKGFQTLASAAFIGEHSYTSELAKKRPDENDEKIAVNFGTLIKDKITDKDLKELKIEGNYPYKEKKVGEQIIPETKDSCIECGICAENCPTTAIDFNDYYSIDKEKCIRCCSCIKKCPVDAKHFNDHRIENVKRYLIDNFGEERKEPVIFI